jgi:hypothetical protein
VYNRLNSRVNNIYSTVRMIMGLYSTNLRIIRAMRYDISYGSYDMTYVRRTISVSRLKTGGNHGTTRSMRAPPMSFQPGTPFWCLTTGISGSGHRNPEFRPKRTTKVDHCKQQPQLSVSFSSTIPLFLQSFDCTSVVLWFGCSVQIICH